ncbi:MAG: hypothetical protein IJO29_05775 [Oscillospiraceae bacterium]|nr:hypothetical protein [Oscillospiraceae bacterium]
MTKRERLRSSSLRNLSVHTIKLLYRPPLKGQVAFEYKGSEMVYMSSSKEIPSEYTLSGENVTINKCSLLISGRKYELYTSDSTDEIVYIYVDDDVVAKQNQGYWQFVSTEIYNDT